MSTLLRISCCSVRIAGSPSQPPTRMHLLWPAALSTASTSETKWSMVYFLTPCRSAWEAADGRLRGRAGGELQLLSQCRLVLGYQPALL